MEVTEAKHENGWLMLRTSFGSSFTFLKSFKPGDYEIKKAANKRSNNANSFAWSLISKIASKTGNPPIEVYRFEIASIGGKTSTVRVRQETYEDFKKAFIKDHLGRNVEIIGDVLGSDGEYYDALITFGSSDYDRQQMSQLIDNCISDCKELDIETADDGYVASLLKDWEAQNG